VKGLADAGRIRFPATTEFSGYSDFGKVRQPICPSQETSPPVIFLQRAKTPRVEEDTISENVVNRAALPSVTLVLGGTRSGKSQFAESLIAVGGHGTYIATAEARDTEMQDRVERHQNRRANSWHTIEAPLNLVDALTAAETLGNPVLIDCLTLWLSNLMGLDRDIDKETDALISRLADLSCSVVIVSNEVGQGIVPTNALTRRFRDHAGGLNQSVATQANHVFFVTAGIPAQLK